MIDDVETPLLLAPAAGAMLAALLALGSDRQRGGWVGRVLSPLILVGGAVGAILLAVAALRGATVASVTGWEVIPGLALRFRLDPLAALLLIVIAVPTIAATLYSAGYLGPRERGGPRPARAGLDAGVALFVAAMTLTVLADSILTFLIAWEVMSLVSFFLVIGNGRRPHALRAGYVYVVMTHLGTAFLIGAFLLLGRHAGGYDFAALRAAAPALDGPLRTAVFLMALVGFGTKAGLIPLHVWLPRAHPAAPSHVSALMSGVMVKTALYGLIRVVWELAGPAPAWWGLVLLGLGAVSGLLGILYALMERDLKRMLAWSTVEHVGVITLGLGSAVLLGAHGRPMLAATALLAALIHLLNHSLFKGLLFLGAGAVEWSAGTRDLERLGGLIRRMPRASGLFLVGSTAIAALPPLNGFVGEWLLLQSLVRTAGATPAATAVGVVLAAAVLGLTGALAVAAFARAFGVGFLAQPRSAAAGAAREAPGSMLAGMGLLAALCVGLGIAPQPAIRLLAPVTEALTGSAPRPGIGFLGVAAPSGGEAAYSPAAVALAIAVGMLGVALAGRLLGGPGRTRVSPTWVCGVDLEPRMPYSATAFAKPLRLIFRQVLRPERAVTRDAVTAPWFVRQITYEERLSPVWEPVYQRVVSGVVGLAHRVRRLQSGSTRAYLAYVFATLVVVLLLAR